MLGRSLASVVALLGGLLVVLGGVIALLLDLAAPLLGAGTAVGAGIGLPLALVAIVLGLLILVFSRFNRWRLSRAHWGSAVALVVLGLLTAWMVGVDLLVLVGAILTILAGLVFALESALRPAWFSRRGLRRRLW